jgi:hypothetical protein
MKAQERFRRRYTCGQHVSGRGRHKLIHGEANIRNLSRQSSAQEYAIGKGVITMLPGKLGEPYTVLDEETFVVLEAKEEDLTPLS